MSGFMRAIAVQNGAGPASALFINDKTPIPEVKSGECLVKIKAFGINRGDMLQREGKFPNISHFSPIMGLEFSGVIASLKEDEDTSDGWNVGDEVFGLLTGGGYAEYVNVNKRTLIRKPETLSFEQVGGLCEVLHFVGGYSPETTRSILWHAGGSAVSIAGIQLSRDAHLISSPDSPPPKVFATARRKEKCDFAVKELGATGAVDISQHPDKRSWVSEIKAQNGGEGIDLVIDFLGGPYLEPNLNVLALDGTVVQIGWLAGPVSQGNVNIAEFMTKRARVQGSQLRTRSLDYQIKLRDFFEVNVLPGLVEGRLKHVLERVVPWDRIAEAHELLESNATTGKVVCTIT